jgi:short-subunit dehydrogenase
VRDELKDTKIKVIGVYPGGIKTDIFSEQPPKNIDEFMSAEEVAEKIIENLELDKPELELVLKRPGQAGGSTK